MKPPSPAATRTSNGSPSRNISASTGRTARRRGRQKPDRYVGQVAGKLSIPSVLDDVADRIEEHEARNCRSQGGARVGTSVSAPPSRSTRHSRYRAYEPANCDIRSRLLLAQAWLRQGDDASVQRRILDGQVRTQYPAGRSERSGASQTRLAMRLHMGMRSQGSRRAGPFAPPHLLSFEHALVRGFARTSGASSSPSTSSSARSGRLSVSKVVDRYPVGASRVVVSTGSRFVSVLLAGVRVPSFWQASSPSFHHSISKDS